MDPKPCSRTNLCPPLLVALQKENEVILFGGEWYDSDKDKTYVYSVSSTALLVPPTE